MYRVRHPRTQEVRALKVLLPQWKDDKTVIASFRDEADILEQFDHPNIPTIFSMGTVRDLPAYSMAMGPATTLRELVLSGKRFDVVGVWASLVRTVAYVHQQSYVHNDLKLLNALVDMKHGRLSLIDFGNAKACGDRVGTGFFRAIKRSFQKPRVFGTVVYAAPEVIERGELTYASDVYALGVCGFALLSGALPLQGLDNQQQQEAILAGNVGSLSESVPKALLPLATIVDRCLSVSPEVRPENAQVLARQVDRFLNRSTGGQRIPTGRMSLSLFKNRELTAS